MHDAATFDELVDEAEAAPVDGWGFDWLAGRATEERPPWGYQRLVIGALLDADAALDVQTGGGEAFAQALGALAIRPVAAATEEWPANVDVARRTLEPLGVTVVAAPNEGPLPFADAAFDLVTSRHPVVTPWAEIARVLAPGGSLLSQQILGGTMRELSEAMLGPLPEPAPESPQRPEVAAGLARAAGLEVVRMEKARTRVEFFDVGAVVWFLRKVVWTVPGFTVTTYREQLRAVHDRIVRDGSFVAHSGRFLIEARRPE